MLYVNHLDNLEKIYAPKEFLRTEFVGYKIIYQRGKNTIEVPCFTRAQLKQEMISLFRKYQLKNKTVNVIGIVGSKEAIRKC